jgi:paraquat-inducible protein B
VNGAAWRVGALALAGLAALALAVIVASSGGWMTGSQRVHLRFDQSVYGLQVGAPVVFRGVRVGQVDSVSMASALKGIPGVDVTASLDQTQLAQLAGPQGNLASLVRAGLSARLGMQSLLTGQLYVELDFLPVKAGAGSAPAAQALGDAATIPTQPSPMQNLQSQLQSVDLPQLARDLSATAATVRQLLAGPLPAKALNQTADAAQAMQALALRLQSEVPGLATAARGTLGEARLAAQAVGQSAGQVAAQAGVAASQLQTAAASVPPTLATLRQAADELTRTASTLGEAAAQDSTLRTSTERALQDTARAARSLRELSDTLEQHPDIWLRGRAPTP